MKKFFDLNKKGFAAYMPLFALCVAAVLHYVLLLAGFKYADAFFFLAVCALAAFMLFKSPLNNKHKIIIFVCLVAFAVAYLIFIRDISVSVASFAVKNPISFAFLGAVFDTFGMLDFARLPLYSSVGGMRIISGETTVGLCELAQKSTSSDAGTLLAVRALSVFAACKLRQQRVPPELA